MDGFNSRLSTVDKTIRALEEIIRDSSSSSSSQSRVWGTHSGLREVSKERYQCSHWATLNHRKLQLQEYLKIFYWPLWALEHTWHTDTHTHVSK